MGKRFFWEGTAIDEWEYSIRMQVVRDLFTRKTELVNGNAELDEFYPGTMELLMKLTDAVYRSDIPWNAGTAQDVMDALRSVQTYVKALRRYGDRNCYPSMAHDDVFVPLLKRYGEIWTQCREVARSFMKSSNDFALNLMAKSKANA